MDEKSHTTQATLGFDFGKNGPGTGDVRVHGLMLGEDAAKRQC